VKTHLAAYERGARTIEQLRAKLAAAEMANAAPLVELAKIVGRPQAASLVGVDVRVVNRAYRTVQATASRTVPHSPIAADKET
jgi:hypothetical protein